MDIANNVTYVFADGTKQICAINPQVMYTDRGKRRSMQEVRNIFESTMHDLGAISFEL